VVKRLAPLAGLAFLAALAALFAVGASRSQRPDDGWDPNVERPAYTAVHPRVVVDEAHYNAHTAGGGYRPFARLLGADGYRVVRGRRPFSAAGLGGATVLVIANASGASKPKLFGINIPIPTSRKREMPAFTAGEIRAVRAWVEQGGSLLLIADHAPFGASAAALAAAFGVRMNRGFVEVSGQPSDPLLFTGARALAADHPIMRGERPGDVVRRVMTFTGQSLDGPPDASVLLCLPDSAIEYVPADSGLAPRPAGRAQGLALACGNGRLVVLGEAAMLTAQRIGEERFGMNTPGNDNRRLALNIMHWLSRRL
jgi:hypothetical protein